MIIKLKKAEILLLPLFSTNYTKTTVSTKRLVFKNNA